MYAEISAAIQSAKSLGELLKAANSLANYNELVAAVTDVSSKLMDATAVALRSQERQAEMLSQIADLKRELDELKRVQGNAAAYELHRFPAGSLAYKLKEVPAGVPEHYLCAKCFDTGAHTKLQPSGSLFLQCHACGSKIQIHYAKASRDIIGTFDRD